MDLRRYKLVSKKRGGQYSGPCWFTGEGTDRFTIEPFSSYGVAWFCRECRNDCPYGYRGRSNMRYGLIKGEEGRTMSFTPKQPPPNTITYEQAIRMAESMNDIGLAYVESRGISQATVTKFHLGMSGGNYVTIPLIYTWKGERVCPAIKMRWIHPVLPAGQPKYLTIPGSKAKGIFNFDLLEQSGEVGIVANSLFDVMLLDSLGYTVIGPFASEADWEERWATYIKWKLVVNIGDWDPEKQNADGTVYRPGSRYMLSRALKLSYAQNVKRIVNTYPPEGYNDISAAWQAGVNIKDWLDGILSKEAWDGTGIKE